MSALCSYNKATGAHVLRPEQQTYSIMLAGEPNVAGNSRLWTEGSGENELEDLERSSNVAASVGSSGDEGNVEAISGGESDGDETGDDESHGSPSSSSDDDTPTNKKRRIAVAPLPKRGRAKITGPQAIVSLGSDIARGLTSLASSFLSAEMAIYTARKSLNEEINRSRDLSEEEKLSLLTKLTYDNSLFQTLSTFPKGSIKTKFMKEHSVDRYISP
ncbi:Hypothetical Protein CGB_B9760W [Cryptococcus gattii WM276]|uniref:Uncharacterized protein n=1 Tax=Cryptococcus gattii serotype B (strain WM276 / ATCC MYA-4071) TaxID=367775 RepID=E6R1K1_CRYGW|nr:Hypothetical Protein CGB_B9760W [Cryptococcus gattii WM276]ADV20657.1 Hypothetical Protein CGB_B9760W [Cryptococcus gattii WM276]KJD99448.1 hypothetical protein I311_06985 [Cryptococcus gattii NT-10]